MTDSSGRALAPPSSSSSSSVVTPQQVLSSLMNDGTFDALRQKILAHLKQNEELKKYTTTKVEQSKVLNTSGADQKSRRELFEALRKELEGPVLEKASREVWDLILSKEGVGKEIADSVFATYSQLNSKDSSVYSPSDPHSHLVMNADDLPRNQSQSHLNGSVQNASNSHSHTP